MPETVLLELMRAVQHVTDAGVRSRAVAELESSLGVLVGLRDRLREKSAAMLTSPAAIERASVGLRAGLAAVELDLAVKALNTVTALRGNDGERYSVAPRALALNLRIGRRQLLVTLCHVVDIPDTLAEGRQSVPPLAVGNGIKITPDDSGEAMTDLRVLRNIAAYHREHERYYTWAKTQDAADIFREANRLKTLADVWLKREDFRVHSADYTDPKYRAAGCEDINAIDSIASIGVLFMEGEGEPAEIRAIKGKLAALSTAWIASGQWLAAKMEAAWDREAILFRPDWVEGAEARYGAIATGFRVSRNMELAGNCLALALAALEEIDFQPSGVRLKRTTAGERLLTTGWLMDSAAQIIARSAADLSENDVRWTSYLNFLRKSDIATQ